VFLKVRKEILKGGMKDFPQKYRPYLRKYGDRGESCLHWINGKGNYNVDLTVFWREISKY
jgi:hypothetical protein